MAKPTMLVVASRRIAIAYEDNLRVPCDCSEDVCKGAKAYGVFDENDFTISIDTAVSEGRFADTLMHECLHAIIECAGLDVTLDEAQTGLEEQLVNRLTPLFVDFMQRNPSILLAIRGAARA